MITYTAEPGTAAQENLALLASWAGNGDEEPDRSRAGSVPGD
jgi:hypothetical protein